jgi:hypothetical protein
MLIATHNFFPTNIFPTTMVDSKMNTQEHTDIYPAELGYQKGSDLACHITQLGSHVLNAIKWAQSQDDLSSMMSNVSIREQ